MTFCSIRNCENVAAECEDEGRTSPPPRVGVRYTECFMIAGPSGGAGGGGGGGLQPSVLVVLLLRAAGGLPVVHRLQIQRVWIMLQMSGSQGPGRDRTGNLTNQR